MVSIKLPEHTLNKRMMHCASPVRPGALVLQHLPYLPDKYTAQIKQYNQAHWWYPFTVKAIAHWVQNCHFRFFSYSSFFPIKMKATDAKTQKIEHDPNALWRTKVSAAVCKRDCHNVRSYLFFNMRKVSVTQCAETIVLSFVGITVCLYTLKKL